MELGLRTGKFTAGDWKCSISRISEAHADSASIGNEKTPGASSRQIRETERRAFAENAPSPASSLAFASSSACAPISSSTSRSSGAKNRHGHPFSSNHLLSSGPAGSPPAAENEATSRRAPRWRAPPSSRQTQALFSFFLFLFPASDVIADSSSFAHREARAAGQKPPTRGGTPRACRREARFLVSALSSDSRRASRRKPSA